MYVRVGGGDVPWRALRHLHARARHLHQDILLPGLDRGRGLVPVATRHPDVRLTMLNS